MPPLSATGSANTRWIAEPLILEKELAGNPGLALEPAAVFLLEGLEAVKVLILAGFDRRIEVGEG
jgi:hypothetical protein